MSAETRSEPQPLHSYLAKALSNSGKSQAELAKDAEMSPPSVSNILKGSDLPSEEKLRRIVSLLKLDLDTAFELLEIEKVRRQFPSEFNTFLSGLIRTLDFVMSGALPRSDSSEIGLDITVTLFHPAVSNISSAFTETVSAFFKKFRERRSREQKLAVRICTIAPTNFGQLTTRFMPKIIDEVRKDKTVGLIGGGASKVAEKLCLRLREIQESDRWVASCIAENNKPDSGIKIEHRHNFAWASQPSVLVQEGLVLSGSYPADQGYCHAPASSYFPGSASYNMIRRSNELTWRYSSQASYADLEKNYDLVKSLLYSYVDNCYGEYIRDMLRSEDSEWDSLLLDSSALFGA